MKTLCVLGIVVVIAIMHVTAVLAMGNYSNNWYCTRTYKNADKATCEADPRCKWVENENTIPFCKGR